MRIREFTVTGLFGVFSHRVPLNQTDRITIIYGPNGYGKTYLLHLLERLYARDYGALEAIPFTKMEVVFDDGGRLTLERTVGKPISASDLVYCPAGESCRPVVGDAIPALQPVWLISTERLMRYSDTERDTQRITECALAIRQLIARGPDEREQQKLDLLTSLIESKFLYKRLVLTAEEGFVFTGAGGVSLAPEQLSAGEQHAVVLIHELLFVVPGNALILIDEPELSLHILWQQLFIGDLKKIGALKTFDAIIATHSPHIIHDRWDLAVELQGPVV